MKSNNEQNFTLLRYKVVAVVSTTVLPLDGVYQVYTIPPEEREQVLWQLAFLELPHHVGHPATKVILEEQLNCFPAPTTLFPCLQPGEAMICVPIRQGRSDRSQGGTAINQKVTIDDLDIRLVVRLS